jgi:leucyl aminopeptidase
MHLQLPARFRGYFLLTLALLLALLALPPQALGAQPLVECGYDAGVAALLDPITQDSWSAWVKKLSGAEPVTVGGATTTITTRFSPNLFGDGHPSPAYDFVREQVLAWYPAAQVEEQVYYAYSNGTYQPWKNLILTIPGGTYPEQSAILSAHLDSTNPSNTSAAPGADDNATGAAALLEAARVLQGHALPRTLRLIWFTGEEQGLLGSHAYAISHNLSGLQGVVNLDMAGYDGDGDRCFELHVGTQLASDAVGQCFAHALAAYGSPLNPLSYDYLTNAATTRSDHSSFWSQGVGAVEVLENFFTATSPGGCGETYDFSPNYHRSTDTFDQVTLPFAYDTARAAIAAAFSLASPQMPYRTYIALVKN